MSIAEGDHKIPGLDAVPEEYRELIGWAKGIKDSLVDTCPAEHPGDIVPHATWYRGERMVAFGIADEVSRDRGLQMSSMGIIGFAADRIDLALDAHWSDQAFFERYGRLPDPLELQSLCDNEGACDLGLTTDCIMVCVMRKDGEATMIGLPYHVDRKLTEVEFLDQGKRKKAMRKDNKMAKEGDRWYHIERKVHWMDDKSAFITTKSDTARVEGVVFNHIKGTFEQKTLDDQMAELGMDPNDFGLEPDRARFHMDMATVRMLTAAGFAIGVASYTEEEREIVTHSMARNEGARLMDPATGEEVDLSAERAKIPITERALNVLSDFEAMKLRDKLKAEAEEQHERDLAERERRRALRVNGELSEEDKARAAEDKPFTKSFTKNA